MGVAGARPGRLAWPVQFFKLFTLLPVSPRGPSQGAGAAAKGAFIGPPGRAARIWQLSIGAPGAPTTSGRLLAA